LDRHYRGYLTSSDLKAFLRYILLFLSFLVNCRIQHKQKIDRENGIEVNEKVIFYVLKHYDRDQDGKLSFKEFLAMVLPLANPELRTEVTQREPYKVGPKEVLPYDVEYTLARVLHREVKCTKNLKK
jgi:Ca2+-binding EF-hand superfamily protein